MDLSASLSDVASVIQIGEFLWNAAKWGRSKLGRQMRSLVKLAIDEACTASGLLTAELDETSANVQRAASAYIKAHGLSPSYLLGLADERAWEAGMLGTIESIVPQDQAATIFEGLRARLLLGVRSLPALPSTAIGASLHAAEGSETLTLVREVLAHVEHVDDLIASIQSVDRLMPVATTGVVATTAHLTPPRPDQPLRGRDDDLNRLADAMSKGESTFLLAVILGVSGAGKTALAQNLWRRSAAEYGHAWWVDASSGESLTNDLCTIAAGLGVADPFTTEPRLTLTRLRLALQALPAPFLMVLDDLVDSDLLKVIQPMTWGHVVVTTQRGDIESSLTVELTGIGSSAAQSLYRDLTEATESLPLDTPALSNGTYLPVTVREMAIGWQTGSETATVGPHSSATARFANSVARIRTVNEPAVRLLELLALSPPGPVHASQLFGSYRVRADVGVAGPTDPSATIDPIVETLRDYRVVASSRPGSVQLHDVLRLSVLNLMTRDRAAAGWETLAEALLQLLPEATDPTGRQAYLPWLDTIDHLVGTSALYRPAPDPVLGRLALRAGQMRNALAEREAGLEYLTIARQHLPQSAERERSTCEVELARCERHLGDLDGALTRLVRIARVGGPRGGEAMGGHLRAISRVLLDMDSPRLASLAGRAAVRSCRSGASAHSTAMAYSMLGRAYLRVDARRAHEAFAVARQLMLRTFDEHDPIHAWFVDDLAALALMEGDALSAHRLFTEAEPVKRFETIVQDFFCASVSMVGLLIHATVGSAGGDGRR